MANIYVHSDYRKFLRELIEGNSKFGHGSFAKIASRLNVPPATVSQVMKGERSFTAEQALEICEFLELTTQETEYFLILVQIDRAGTFKLKQNLESKRQKLIHDSNQIKNRVDSELVWNENDRILFYSSWVYTGIRLCTDLNGSSGVTVEFIVNKLKLPRKLVMETLDYLVSQKLCLLIKGKYKIGPTKTHLSGDSPLVVQHHANWRVKALEVQKTRDPINLHYSGSMALSEEAYLEIKENLIQQITKTVHQAGKSESETLACLNIDWFKF